MAEFAWEVKCSFIDPSSSHSSEAALYIWALQKISKSSGAGLRDFIHVSNPQTEATYW